MDIYNDELTQIDQFIIEQLKKLDNLLKFYDPDYIYNYPQKIFSLNNPIELERLYLEYTLTRDGVDFLEILPICADYVQEEFNNSNNFMDNLISENWYYFFGLYALSVGKTLSVWLRKDFDHILYEYDENVFNLAIKKLKRNKIVNNGFLLKVSIRKCGLF